MPTRESYEPGRPTWVDLGSPDPAASRSFYSELFAWDAEVDARPEAGGYAQFRKDGQSVAGVGPLFQEGMPPVWTTYIATDDADATARKITEAGGTVVMEPFDILDVGRMAVFAGPDGAVAGIWEARAHHGAGLVNEPGSWCWSQLMSPDKALSVRFYGDAFGWTLQQHPEWGEYLALGDGEIAAVSQIGTDTPAEVPPSWQVVFMVADVEATLARAQELGASVTTPPVDAGPGARAADLVDPQGAAFGVMSVDPQS
jgi:uncharacterized protein